MAWVCLMGPFWLAKTCLSPVAVEEETILSLGLLFLISLFFFSTSLFTFLHTNVFYLSYIFLSYSLEKERHLILNDSLLEII